MIVRIGNRLSAAAERWMPDPYIFAVTLTFLTFALAFGFGREVADLGFTDRMAALGQGWYGEFFSKGLMKFALQMCLILVTGHALAMSGPVRGLIRKLAGVVSTPRAAVVLVSIVACIASLLSWGLGAIVGAFIAREVGRAFAERDIPVHYPLLGAAGYAGFLVWHGGFSGSAPLSVAQPDHFLISTVGVIPFSETTGSLFNLIITGTLLVLIPTVFWLLMPRDESKMRPYFGGHEPEPVTGESVEDSRAPFVRTLESSYYLNALTAFGILGFLTFHFATKGWGAWNFDSINMLTLGVGIAAHRSPESYVSAIVDGVKGTAGIILQFPFYFGILGLMKSSGLIIQVAEAFVAISTPDTFPIFTFLSAGIVNFFVPSGGGQWAVQGPVMMEAVGTLGIEPGRVIMALAYGDAWTNMLQPFWALPLLGIMGLKARDIVGYTALLLIVSGPVIMLLLYLL